MKSFLQYLREEGGARETPLQPDPALKGQRYKEQPMDDAVDEYRGTRDVLDQRAIDAADGAPWDTPILQSEIDTQKAARKLDRHWEFMKAKYGLSTSGRLLNDPDEIDAKTIQNLDREYQQTQQNMWFERNPKSFPLA